MLIVVSSVLPSPELEMIRNAMRQASSPLNKLIPGCWAGNERSAWPVTDSLSGFCACKVQEQPLQSATAAEDSTQGSLSSSWHLLSGCPATCTYHITLGGVDTVGQGLYRNPLHWHFCYSALTVVIAAVDLLGQPKVCHTHRHVIP